MTSHGYHESTTEVAEGTIGAWTLVVGRFDDDTYCVDHYSRASARKTRLYFATRDEAMEYTSTFVTPKEGSVA